MRGFRWFLLLLFFIIISGGRPYQAVAVFFFFFCFYNRNGGIVHDGCFGGNISNFVIASRNSVFNFTAVYFSPRLLSLSTACNAIAAL
jgi:hypothetical protein